MVSLVVFVMGALLILVQLDQMSIADRKKEVRSYAPV